jgi:ubiquitin carboxyl-terminal hydrolase 25/28
LHEIDLLMVMRPQDEGSRTTVFHVPALKDIERSLGCFDYPKRNRTVDLSIEEHPCYISLGAVDDFTDKHLEWAYERQCECDPSNKPYYLDCLADLANGRQSADLQTRLVMATSAGELGLKVIEDSYRYFNLDPDSVEGDGHIMGLYKSRIESAPRQKDEARECLLNIAKHRNSEKIEALANDKTMSFEEALEFLGISADTASDSIEASAVALVSVSPLFERVSRRLVLSEA